MLKNLCYILVVINTSSSFASEQTVSRQFASVPEAITQIVGHVDKKPITSREVLWYDFIESHFQNKSSQIKKIITSAANTSSSEFISKTTKYSLARAIALDAEQFEFPKPKSEDVQMLSQKVIKSIEALKIAEFYKPSSEEILKLIQVKLVSEQFLKFKSQSSALPITDADAKIYFDENKNKFAQSGFESVKSQIKVQIAKSQIDSRMNTWYNLLQEKYGYKDVVK
jgi:hypothetical protein